MRKTTSQIICQNFNLPSQTIFQDYKCSLSKGITSFGRLYVGQQHLMFISNMFGIVKKIVIDIEEMQSIEKQSKNKISIKVLEKKQSQKQKDPSISSEKSIHYVFGDFLNDKCFQLIKNIWRKDKIDPQILKEDQQKNLLLQNSQQSIIDSNSVDNQAYACRQSRSEQSAITNQVRRTSSIYQGKVQANYFNPQVVQNSKQKLVDIQLPCKVSQFFDFFVADNGQVYPRNLHFEFKKAQNIFVSKWRATQQANCQTRQLRATIKVQGVPFINQAGMSQVWILKKSQNYESEGMQIDIVTQMSDVPYAAYFTTQQFIKVSPIGQTRSRMSVQTAVVFNKSTYLKNTLIKRALGDSKIDYEIWVKNVNRLLDQLRKKNQLDNYQTKDSPLSLSLSNSKQKNQSAIDQQTTQSYIRKNIPKKLQFQQTLKISQTDKRQQIVSLIPQNNIQHLESTQSKKYLSQSMKNIQIRLQRVQKIGYAIITMLIFNAVINFLS